jgi:hypothetical protein
MRRQHGNYNLLVEIIWARVLEIGTTGCAGCSWLGSVEVEREGSGTSGRLQALVERLVLHDLRVWDGATSLRHSFLQVLAVTWVSIAILSQPRLELTLSILELGPPPPHQP